MENCSYTETKTWKTWQGSVLSNFKPNSNEAKPLFGLLLAAASKTNLEALSTSPALPVTCHLSVELRKALTKVWRVMKKNDEQWAILAASLEGLMLGVGFTTFYWDELCQGKPIVRQIDKRVEIKITNSNFTGREEYQAPIHAKRYADGRGLDPLWLYLPICDSDQFFLDAEVRDEKHAHSLFYRGEIDLKAEVDHLRRVEVGFFYTGHGQMHAVMVFDKRIFTESNIIAFRRMMPEYSLVEFHHESHRHDDPTVCYSFSLTNKEVNEVIHFGDFLYWDSNNTVTGHYRYFKPKDGFLGLVKTKLNELNVPFADTVKTYL